MNPEGYRFNLSGSLTSFRSREGGAPTPENKEQLDQNKNTLIEGLGVLRRYRTKALETPEGEKQQEILKDSHDFSREVANVIFTQTFDGIKPLEKSFITDLKRRKDELSETDEGSGHSLPPQFSINNLFKATEDIATRVLEKTGSIESPSHKLSEAEMLYVLKEFLVGTNDLSLNAREDFFKEGTMIGGILTGGSLYLEIVKKVTERFGDRSFSIDTFVVAVDKENKKVSAEVKSKTEATKTVILTDDMIDGGGTMLTALNSIGKYFPNARITCGLGNDKVGGFQERFNQKFNDHLYMLFCDFIDLCNEDKYEEALKLMKVAEKYAEENNVKLTQGWYIRKEKIEKSQES